MRIVTGCIQSTPVPWLPVLSHIAPPDLRRQGHLVRELNKIRDSPDLPVRELLQDFRHCRLKSRHPPALAFHQQNIPWDVRSQWKEDWAISNYNSDLFTFDAGKPAPGFDQRRSVWCRINRMRTGHGKCGYMRHKWGWSDSAACPCGCPEQTVRHIIFDCPLHAYNGPMEDLRNLTPAAVSYINSIDDSLL